MKVKEFMQKDILNMTDFEKGRLLKEVIGHKSLGYDLTNDELNTIIDIVKLKGEGGTIGENNNKT